MDDLVFVLCAALCLISAMAIVTRKNPVYSVVCMLPFFLGMAGLFVLLSAPFLAAMEIMVYGGAILVVFLFVIMLINVRPEDLKDDFNLKTYLGTALACGLMGGMILSFARAGVPDGGALDKAFNQKIGVVAQTETSAQSPTPAPKNDAAPAASRVEAFGSIRSLSLPLFQQYVVPFELIGVLLTVGLLGAMILSKE